MDSQPNNTNGNPKEEEETTLKPPSKDPKTKDDKKDDDLSEEDLALKHQLELYVERAQDADQGLQKVALESMRQEIRTSTSSMTSVPKPLKFLRPHYGTLKSYYEMMPESELKKLLADILSVLALTMSAEGERESLKYRLLGSEGDIGSWGHEYVRNLAGEIAQEYSKRVNEEAAVDDLIELVEQIAAFHMKQNAEPEAVDLLMEVEFLDLLMKHVDKTNHKRTCLYLTSSARYLPGPDDISVLDIAYSIYNKFEEFPRALQIALYLDNMQPTSSKFVQGFCSLRVLNLEDNYIADWGEILKLSQLKCLEQLHLNKNNIEHIWYPTTDEGPYKPFQNLRCLLIGGNKIEDLASIDALNSYPALVDIRCSENPATDPSRGGVGRYGLVARLAKVKILNGSEITPRERKESEIRYVRLVMSKPHQNLEEIKRLHPRFTELKAIHGIEDERPSSGPAGPQKMASGLITVTLKCVGPSICEKAPITKKLPATTTVGKLKTLCLSFFKLKFFKPILYLQEEGSPLHTLLDDDMASLNDAGVCNQSTILVDEEH